MLLSGTILGKYTVEGLIGGGGFGLVYRATQRGPAGFVQEVALKTVHPSAEDGLATLMREARIFARLRHRNVVQVYDLASHGAIWFLVMEYVEGLTLRELRDKKLPLWVRVGIGAEMAAGLEYAHTLCDQDGAPLGLIHRDIKPSNILLGRSGAVKLADFGLAKLSLRPSDERTEAGVVKGTPAYMSPEQREGEPATAASDIFCLAAVLHELCTGVNPAVVLVDGRSRECLPSVAARARPEADEPTARALEALLGRALSIDPRRRPSAAQAGDELRRIVVELAPASNPGRLTEALAHCVDDALGLNRPRHADPSRPTQSLSPPRSEETASVPSEVVLDLPVLGASELASRTWSLERELRQTDPADRSAVLPPFSSISELRPPRRRFRQGAALAGACALLAIAGLAFALLSRPSQLEVTQASAAGSPDARQHPIAVRLSHDLGIADSALMPPDAGAVASLGHDARVGERRTWRPGWYRRKLLRRETKPTPVEAPGVGWLSLNAEPWAQVYVDGRRLATTPIFRHPLPAGAHTLRLVGANRRTAARNVIIVADRHLNLGMIPLAADR